MFCLSNFQYVVIEQHVCREHLLLFSVFGVSIYRNRATCMQGVHCRTLGRDLMSGKFGPTSPKYHLPIVRSTRLLNTIDQSSKVPPRYQFESIKYVSYILQKISENTFQGKLKIIGSAFTHMGCQQERVKNCQQGLGGRQIIIRGGK